MAERFQRRYGINQAGPDGSEQMHATIAQQLGGFKSQAANLGVGFARQQGMAKARQDAAAYDGTQAPELKTRSNAASQKYNEMVLKTYQTQVQNRAMVRVGELAEQFKNDPTAFGAAVARRRAEIINEAGPSARYAVVAFDTVAAKHETDIRTTMIKANEESSRVEFQTALNHQESLIMDYAADGGADPKVMEDLLAGFDDMILSPESTRFHTPEVTQKMAIDIRKRATERVYKAELDGLLTAGKYTEAAKWIQGIRNRQITTGKMTDIMRQTGQTPEQLAESLTLSMKAHGELTADAIGQASKERTNRLANIAAQGQEVEKSLIDLGSDLTIKDVEDARPFLDAAEYRDWRARAEGKPPEVNSLEYNQLYADTLLAVNSEDYDAIAESEADAVDLFRRGRMTRAEYNSLREMSQESRFGPGMDLFDGLSKAAQQMGKMASTMGLVRAKRDFNAWMKQNPTATAAEADEKATAFVRKYVPSLLKGIEGVESAMAAQQEDNEVALFTRYREKHNGDNAAVQADPDYLRELLELQNNGKGS